MTRTCIILREELFLKTQGQTGRFQITRQKKTPEPFGPGVSIPQN